MSIRGYLLRGAVAGLLAGLVAGVLAFFVAEPIIDRAVNAESARVAAQYRNDLDAAILRHHGDVAAAKRDVPAPEPAVFSRDTQHIGLIVATALFGLAVGGVFAVVFLMVARRSPPRSIWQRSVGLALAMLAGIYLLPFLRYPANPPGVGDPSTIDRRTYAYALAVGISCLAVWGAWRVALLLRDRGADEPLRHVAVVGVVVVAVVLLFATLPDNTDAVNVPATLLWDFRIRSAATQLVLWGGLGAGFAVLTERAMRRATLGVSGGAVGRTGWLRLRGPRAVEHV
jgi:predicted cobalt transporter CbtA